MTLTPKIDDFVVKNEGRGAYIDISNVNTAFNSLATLIVNENSTKYELYNYVEVGQEFDVSTYYYDYENDPAYQHNFVYTHNPNYFENSNGLASNMNVVLTNPNTRFDKVGEYVIEYKAKDNPRSSVYFDNYRLWSEPKTMKIYAHRKPYANFTVTAVANGSSYNVVYEDNSYDLDHLSLPDKGIVTKNWYYRESSSSTWISGKLPATIPADKEYYVKLEVMDMEYSWDSSVQLVSTKPINLKPVAQFRFAKNPASKYQYTAISNVIIDTSFDPNGDSITEKKWTVTKNGVVQSNGINTNLTSAGEGQYAVTLEVKDSKGLWSEPFTQILTVTGDVTPPTISISPTSRGWSDLGMTVNISASDTGGSALKEIRYLWTKNETNPDGQFTVVQNTGYLSLQQNTDGIWYLYAQAVDNAGNASEVVKGGAYKVDKSPPSLLNFRVSGEDYKQDTTFWIAKNNMLEVYINANEQLSGMYLTYLRIPYYSDNRAYHVWIDSWNNVVEFDTGTETRIENAERTIYDPEKGEYEVRFGVRGLNDVVSDLQYCLMDMVDNQTGYINSGYMIGVDTIPPVISITHEELDLSNRSREVSISVEDSGCGVRETKYIVTTDNTKPSNGAGWITEYNRVFNVQVTGTGTWYLYIDSTDNVGNTASQVIGPFRVDMDGPILTANPINRAWGNTNAVITLTATEGYSELKEVRYSLTKSTQRVYTNWKTVTTSSINTVTIPEDGVWYLHAEAEDIAGNITYTYFGPYRVDKEPPVLNINYISGARYISGNNYYAKRGDIVTFQLQGYDALSGIWRLFAMSRGGAGTDPYRSLSKDGSTLQYNDHTKIRVNPPINQYVNYYELRADFPFEVLTAEDYTYIIEGIADDNANFNRYGWVDSGYRLITDNTAPVGQVTFTTNTSSLIADITASDNASGVKEIRYSWSTDPETTISHYTTVTGDTAQAIQTEEGVWYLFLQIEDNCNNVYYYRTDAQELKLLSLYDFNVSDVSDSNWTDVFYAKSGALKGVEYYVDSLPILENPNFYDRFGAVPRKGFEFRFNVKSIGMEEATDRIRITPKFYYWDGYSTRVECNMVYPVLISTFPERYNLIQAGTPAELNHDASKIYDFHDAGLGKPKTKVYLGTYGEIVLDERQRTILADEQLWTGVYKVPDGAVLVPIGQNIMDKDNWITEGYLIVNLQIEAIKNNSIEFTYVPDQWVIESGPRNALYMSGDTIVYNLEQSAFSDYDVRVDR